MNISFSKPLADASNFPPPKILGLPNQVELNKGSHVNMIEGDFDRFFLNSARNSLFIIGKTLKKRTVWVPSYHCPALIEPFMANNCEIKFYSLSEKLTPVKEDLTDLKQDDLLVAVRFFGFGCGIETLSTLCEHRGAILIEDLAHAAHTNKIYAQLAVTSLTKFYPKIECSELFIHKNAVLNAQIKKEYNQLPNKLSIGISTLLHKIKRKLKIYSKNQYRYFDPFNIDKNISKNTLSVINNTDTTLVIKKRIDNFNYLAKNLSNSSYGKLLFNQLSNGEVPYVCPFIISKETTFTKLRNAGVQIYRWEELAQSNCSISHKYRSELIQLPCHQDITQQDLDLIINLLQ
jgi:hypothetical protein